MSVRVGVVLPSREAVMAGGADADASLLIGVAERAEALGFDSVWVGDSLFNRPRFEPITMLAAIASRTQRVELGTAVLIASQRHPLLLAAEVASLDRIANGRVVLGVGAGWIPQEFQALGVPFEQREGRLRDTMGVCRALWRGERPTSRYHDLPEVSLMPRPARPGGPPVWIGGFGPKALRSVGRLFDGWMPMPLTPERFAEGWATVRAHAEEAGRDPSSIETAVYLTVNITDDAAAGEKESAAYAEGYYGLPFDVMRRGQPYFIGDEDACAAWLRGYADAGVRHLLLRFATLDPMPQLERAAGLLGKLR